MSLCLLCGQGLSKHFIIQQEKKFCCKGCSVVYDILSTQNISQNLTSHPLFIRALEGGLISNPQLLEQIQSKSIQETHCEKLHIEITNLWCPSCSEVIELYLMHQEGIKNCWVDYSTDLAVIDYYPQIISKQTILDWIEGLGYQSSTLENRQRKVDRSLLLRLAVAIFCAMNIMMFSYPIYAQHLGFKTEGYAHYLSYLSFFTAIPVVTYCAWPIWKRAINGIKFAIFGMESLILLGSSASFLLSTYHFLYADPTQIYLDSLSMLIVFVLLGKILEQKAKFSSRNALFYLERSLPRKARMVNADEMSFVPLKMVKIGDMLRINQGEKVPLDGHIVEGSGYCDESLLSGEALPVFKKEGMSLICGSIVQTGHFLMRVDKTLDQTTLQKVIDTIRKDIHQKTKMTPLVDRIVKWFVPFLIASSLLFFLFILAMTQNWNESFLRLIALLLIACPCAIGIATPLVESVMLGAFIKMGVIIRNRKALYLMGKETFFIFDKTGTLTTGKFQLKQEDFDLSQDEKALLRAMCFFSQHPICLAIFQNMEAPQLELKRVEEILGKGLKANFKGDDYFLGSRKWMQELAIFTPSEEESSTIATEVFFAKKDKCIRLLLEDQLQEGVESFVKSLNVPTVILSGDGKYAVKQVAEKLNVTEWIACCSAFEKRDYLLKKQKQGHTVALFGDGINDAPAMTAADISISAFCASDLSMQVSDLLLTKPSFEVMTAIWSLAIKGQKIMKQNLFWAFFYNAIGIGCAALGWLTPLYAALAMVLSSLFVVLNSYRLNFLGPWSNFKLTEKRWSDSRLS